MRKLQTKHLVLLTLNATLYGLITLAWRGNLRLSATKRVAVELMTEPNRVRVTINGTVYEDGAYIQTPTTLNLLPGKHKIMLQRSGYHSNTSTIIANLTDDSQKINSVLEATNSANLREVVIDSEQRDALPDLEISIDGGFEVGTLPLTASDLLAGTHILELKSGSWIKGSVRCQFEIPVNIASEQMKIFIEKNGKHLRIHGCKKIKN